jgi:hypothetical protein
LAQPAGFILAARAARRTFDYNLLCHVLLPSVSLISVKFLKFLFVTESFSPAAAGHESPR